MRRSIPLLMLMALFTLISLLTPRDSKAISAIPTTIELGQPDGQFFSARILGDEWYHSFESADGYAIVRRQDGWWTYARLDADGRFQSSDYRVGMADPGMSAFLTTVGVHLKEDPSHRTAVRESAIESALPGIIDWAKTLERGDRVTMNVPVLLIQYPDFFASQTLASFNNMFNQAGYNGTGSFNDYYQEVSYGNLTVAATVVGWYTAANNRIFYKHGTGSIPEVTKAKLLVREAVNAAEAAGMNWVPFDNDIDGNVDIVFAVHQGPGAECGNTNFIWSHHWYLNSAGTNYSVTYDGKLIDRYIIQPETSCGGGHIEIGVFCHEFGHALGLPDLYDIDGSSEGIGLWGLMGSGGWGGNQTSPELPTHMEAWSKAELGWISPTVVPGNTTGALIPRVETNPLAYKLWTNGMPAQEYFLVENRQKTGFDANLPTGGLAIWHVDMNKRVSNNTDNADEFHKLLDVEEADGLLNLDNKVNRGDAGDLYPGSSVNRFFNGGTNPDSDDYTSAPTQVCVDNISNSAATMTADFCVSTGGGTSDLLIRDCAADLGAEPDAACAGNWVQSLDIWVDNNDDGIIDAPIKGSINHLYVRAWNLGGNDTNANIKCWYVNPSLGLNFGLGSPGTQISDAVTFQTQLNIPSIGNLMPTPGGLGYRAYFNWLIPNPPPNIDHYCIGCVIESANDPQLSPVPLQENNLGQINYWALALKAGTTPAKSAAEDSTRTIFREQINVCNRYDEPGEFLVLVEVDDPEITIDPAEFTLLLGPHQCEPVTFDMIKVNSEHQDSAQVAFRLYRMPNFELVGGLFNDLAIDNYEPLEPPGWDVSFYTPQGDNYPRPIPRYELSWGEVERDVAGFPEKPRYYDVFASPDEDLVAREDSSALVAKTKADADPNKPGFQYHYFSDDEETIFFAVRAVDMAGNIGPATPARTAQEGTSVPEQPGTALEFTLDQNYPNPFNPRTTVSFVLWSAQRVTIGVYNLSGQRMAVLADEVFSAGTHQLTWDARDETGHELSSGVYFVKLETAAGSQMRKMTLLR